MFQHNIFLDRLFKVSKDCTSTVKQILQYLPDEALLGLAAATYEDRFYNKSTFPQTNSGC